MTIDQENEIWFPIIGFEGLYEISNKGRVKSLPRWRKNRFNGYFTTESIMKGKTATGYHTFELSGKASPQSFKRSRLVAIHFIPNPNKLPFVNHIDGNKFNDDIKNLEWCTPSENELHAYRTGLKKAAYLGKYGKDHNQSKPVLAIQDTSITEFDSKTSCGLYLNVTVQAVAQAIKNNNLCRGHLIIAI